MWEICGVYRMHEEDFATINRDTKVIQLKEGARNETWVMWLKNVNHKHLSGK